MTEEAMKILREYYLYCRTKEINGYLAAFIQRIIIIRAINNKAFRKFDKTSSSTCSITLQK